MDLIGIDWVEADDFTWNFRQQDAVNDTYGILMNWTHIVSCHLWTKCCMFLPSYRCYNYRRVVVKRISFFVLRF